MANVMLFYKNTTVLNREEHKNLKLKAVEGFGFAENTHWLPVAGVEFYQASRHYPIMFVSEGTGDKEVVTPILLVGLDHGNNAYVDKDHKWKADAYLPAFVRRYPFVPANADEKKNDEFMVCYDAAFAGFNTKEGMPLFNEDGTETDLLKGAVQFLLGFNNDMQRTRTFVEELRKLDILEKRSADIRNASGATFQVQDFLVVSEEKFAKLTGPQLEKLHKEGFLGWVFAHLMSLANLPTLLDLHLARKAPAKK